MVKVSKEGLEATLEAIKDEAHGLGKRKMKDQTLIGQLQDGSIYPQAIAALD